MEDGAMDRITELADRLLARQRRGERWDRTRDRVRGADRRGAGRLDAWSSSASPRPGTPGGDRSNQRCAEGAASLQVRKAPGMTVREAIGSGHISLLEVVEAIHGVPDRHAARARGLRPGARRLCQQGCTCHVQITVETVEGLDAPAAAVHHDDWCPLLRTMQERTPGGESWQAVIRPGSIDRLWLSRPGGAGQLDADRPQGPLDSWRIGRSRWSPHRVGAISGVGARRGRGRCLPAREHVREVRAPMPRGGVVDDQEAGHTLDSPANRSQESRTSTRMVIEDGSRTREP